MNHFENIVKSIDRLQRNNKYLGFMYSIIKKYGQDNGGYQSATITYYGILSLFPLLIVLTTLSQLFLKNNPTLRSKIAESATHYFPIIGEQLQSSIHSSTKTGLALFISLLIIFYGARGVANALQYTVTYLWQVPRVMGPNFIQNILRSFGIIVAGGVGFIFASFISTYLAFKIHSSLTKVVAIVLSTIILWVTFIIIYKLAVAGNKKAKQVIVGAGLTAIGIQILQTLGGVILAHQLKGLHNDYGVFALVIGLLFWINLQAQVVLYSVEVDVIRTFHLYPRGITGDLTDADQKAYARNIKYNKLHKDEAVVVKFP